MCGIVGLMSLNNGANISKSLLSSMRDTMVHRGPDGGGIWISSDERIGFGHRRLSIIDLSTNANQPMSNEDGSIWVTFNGEIYNHSDIRKELEQTGNHTWKTNHSDTEVIVHAFEEWGIECLHKFRGMFAIGIWDMRSRCLWLARDRLGIKPLYYSFYKNKFAFASEIKAILADPDRTRSVNEESLFHYLSFLTTPAPDTLFEGIKKLPNGCWLQLKENGSIKEHRYWDVLDHTYSLEKLSEEEIAHQLLEELKTSVQLRKISDVPAGVFLSGGIDSSANAALFSQNETNKIKTFSIGYQGNYESYQNELHYAQQVAKFVGAEYYEKLLNVDDLINFLPRMVQLQDEPIADPVCVPVYYVSKLARENGVIVCQVGEGSDELFWGYPSWKRALSLQQWNDIPIPSSIKKTGLFALKAIGKNNGFPYEWLRRGSKKQPIFWGGAEAFTDSHKKKLLSHRLQAKFQNRTSWEVLQPIHERFQKKAREKSHLNWMSYIDLNLRLPELLLMRVDKMSMGVSLEARVPFLDHKFVEYAMSIPTNTKIKNGNLKNILKKSVRGVIPDNIIDRSKQGFGVPIYEWLFEKLGTQIHDELCSFCDKTDYFNKSEIIKLLQSNKSHQIWYLFNFALWWKEFIE